MSNFMKRVQSTAKVRAVRSKIRKNKADAKKLSRMYEKAVKLEAKRLAKKKKR